MTKTLDIESLGKLINTHVDCGQGGMGHRLKIGIDMISFDLVRPVRESSK